VNFAFGKILLRWSARKCIYSVPVQETAKHHAKFAWFLLSEVAAVMKPSHETCWNLLECPNYMNWSQPLEGQSLPFCEDMWGRYGCLTSFFQIVNMCLSFKDIAQQSSAMVRGWRMFGIFLRSLFSASHLQHISDLHPKSALRPHQVLTYGRPPICDGWEYVRKKTKKKIERRKHRENIMACSIP